MFGAPGLSLTRGAARAFEARGRRAGGDGLAVGAVGGDVQAAAAGMAELGRHFAGGSACRGTRASPSREGLDRAMGIEDVGVERGKGIRGRFRNRSLGSRGKVERGNLRPGGRADGVGNCAIGGYGEVSGNTGKSDTGPGRAAHQRHQEATVQQRTLGACRLKKRARASR